MFYIAVLLQMGDASGFKGNSGLLQYLSFFFAIVAIA